MQVLAVDEDRAGGGRVHLGEEIKDSGLPGAVGADEAGDLRFADGEVEIVHGLEAAEFDTKVAGLHNRDLIHITLGDDGMGRHGDHFGIGAVLLLLCHLTSPPPAVSRRSLWKSFLTGAKRRSAMARVVGLLVKIITRISTTA